MLLLKYKGAPSNSATVIGKYGCPGGRLDFGESPDASIVREVLEETGVKIEPKDPVGLHTWFVQKEDEHNQIVAVFRICKYISGKLKGYVSEEAKIEAAEWVDIATFNFEENVIEDDLEIINKVLKFLK